MRIRRQSGVCVVALALLSSIGGCTGSIGETSSNRPRRGVEPPPSAPEKPPSVDNAATATDQRARRISVREYDLAVANLLGVEGGATAIVNDPLVRGFDNQSDALSISTGNFDEFASLAQMLADAAPIDTLAPCSDGMAPVICASSFARSFARKAYGRSLSDEEHDRMLGLYRQGVQFDGYERGIRTIIEAVLVSPYFLYRTELGRDVGEGRAILDSYEMANAVAFALTGERPDDELLAHAEQGDLARPEILREEASRLSASLAAKQHLSRFLRGWLGVPDLRTVNKVPVLFPPFTPTMKGDLEQELSLFLDFALSEENGTLETLLGSSVSFPSATILAGIYADDYASTGATPPPFPPPGVFARTELDPSKRRGVLSLGGWLSAHSPVHRSSPVDRGLTIRTRFFCQNLAPPPPGAVNSAPGGGDRDATTRQKFEKHTTDPSCQSCHRLMDPIGFGFESMDAIGRFRTLEVGLPVDSRGALSYTDVDGPFEGPAQLAERLVASREVRDCFVRQMFRYVEGRDEESADQPSITALQEFFAAPGRPIRDLAVEMVARQGFGERRIEP